MAKENVNDAALAYMERKYGEEFTYVGPWDTGFSGAHTLLVSCESFPGRTILVAGGGSGSGQGAFRDNYLAIRYEQDVRDFLRECALKEFGDANVFYEAPQLVLDAGLPAGASFAEYLAGGGAALSIMIEARESEFSSLEQAERIARRIADGGADYYLTVVAVEESLYGSLTRGELDRGIAAGEFACCASLTWVEGSAISEWREGNLR